MMANCLLQLDHLTSWEWSCEHVDPDCTELVVVVGNDEGEWTITLLGDIDTRSFDECFHGTEMLTISKNDNPEQSAVEGEYLVELWYVATKVKKRKQVHFRFGVELYDVKKANG